MLRIQRQEEPVNVRAFIRYFSKILLAILFLMMTSYWFMKKNKTAAAQLAVGPYLVHNNPQS